MGPGDSVLYVGAVAVQGTVPTLALGQVVGTFEVCETGSGLGELGAERAGDRLRVRERLHDRLCDRVHCGRSLPVDNAYAFVYVACMTTKRNRVVRVDDATWDAAKATAQQQGTTVSKVIRDLLARYARAGGIAALAVVVLLGLSACGGTDEPAAQVADAAPVVTAEVSEPVVVKPSEPVVECWDARIGTDPDWIVAINDPNITPEDQLAMLEALPDDPSLGCKKIDRQQLAAFGAQADQLRASLIG